MTKLFPFGHLVWSSVWSCLTVSFWTTSNIILITANIRKHFVHSNMFDTASLLRHIKMFGYQTTFDRVCLTFPVWLRLEFFFFFFHHTTYTYIIHLLRYYTLHFTKFVSVFDVLCARWGNKEGAPCSSSEHTAINGAITLVLNSLINSLRGSSDKLALLLRKE